ncbi:MAG: sulfurtransferase [Cryomorphaceae bacterium]|nr:hypothetical protein [Flavobacteriales bacterium]
MSLRTNTYLFLTAILISACSRPGDSSLQQGPLIEVEALQQMMETAEPPAIIDVRPRAEYLKGHLPGAVNFWRTDLERTDTAYSGLVLSRNEVAKKLSAKGITSSHNIVLYDDRGGVEAGRVLWLLRRYGHDRLQLLNGGLQSWGNILEPGETESVPEVFKFNLDERTDMNVDYETFEQWRVNPNTRLIDCRSEVEFSGKEFKAGAFEAGHIPGAINFCYSHCINMNDQLRTRTLEELTAMYAPLASPEDTVLLYCHSGVRSAYTWFVLTELLGYENVYNYDGSWIEWSYFHNAGTLNDTLNKHT